MSGFYACLDADGSIQSVALLGSSVDHSRWTSQRILGGEGNGASLVHPRDSYISSISHGKGGTSNVLDVGGHTVTSKRPWGNGDGAVVVGEDGEHGGYVSIQDAVDSLKGIGGKVLVREGYSRVTHPIRLWSGIQIIGTNSCYIDLVGIESSSPAFRIAGSAGMTLTAADFTNQIYSFSGSKFISGGARPGDVVMFYDDASTKPVTSDSGTLVSEGVITRVLSETEIALSVDASADVMSMTFPMAAWFATGCSIQNVDIVDNRGVSRNVIEAIFAADLNLKVSARSTTASAGLSIRSCRRTRIASSEIDASVPLDLDGDSYGIMLDYGTSLVDCEFNGGPVEIGQSHGFEKLRVSGSTSRMSWNISNVTDVPVWTNNGGTVSGVSFDSITDWGDSATLFAQKIKLNQAKLGHIDGDMHPFTDKNKLGSSSNRWDISSSKILSETDHLTGLSPLDFDDMSILSKSSGGWPAAVTHQPGIASVGGPNGHRINFIGSVHKHLTEIQASGEPISSVNGSDELTLTRTGVNTISLRPGMLCVFSGMTSYSGILRIVEIVSSTKIKVGRLYQKTKDIAASSETGTVVFYRGTTIGVENDRSTHVVISGGYDNRGGIELGVNDNDQDGYGLSTIKRNGDLAGCIDGHGNFVDQSDGLVVVVDPLGVLDGFTVESGGRYIESSSSSGAAYKSLNGIIPDGAIIDSMRVDWAPGQAGDIVKLDSNDLFGAAAPASNLIVTITATASSSRTIYSATISPTKTIDRQQNTYRISMYTGGSSNLIIYGIEIGFHMPTRLTNIR